MGNKEGVGSEIETASKTPVQNQQGSHRRSERKSVRPIFQYDEIVSGSFKKKKLEYNFNQTEGDDEIAVGKNSKRLRKSKRNTKKNISLSDQECHRKLIDNENKDDEIMANTKLDEFVGNIPKVHVKTNKFENLNEAVILESEITDATYTDSELKEKPADGIKFGKFLLPSVSDMADLGLNILEGADEKTQDTTSYIKIEDCVDGKQFDMETLRFSDDEIREVGKENIVNILPLNEPTNTPSVGTLIAKGKHPKPYRFGTPYKPASHFNFGKNMKSTTFETKDTTLKSEHKNSTSLAINRAARNVTFCSPANQIVDTDFMDQCMISNAKKKIGLKSPGSKQTTNITLRRKRSLSVDSMNGKIKKPTVVASITKYQKPFARTVLPNFAVIHEKNFGKMENLVEHMERKAERAKILTNSALKSKTASTQKSLNPGKNEKKGSGRNKTITSIKASTSMSTSNDELDAQLMQRLPKPFLSVIPRKEESTAKSSKTLITTKTKSNAKAPLKPCNSAPPAPLKKINPIDTTAAPITTAMAPTTKPDILEARRQQHMLMFKGRQPVSRRAIVISETNKEIIRGVRSNRRFELQMAHRKNIQEH